MVTHLQRTVPVCRMIAVPIAVGSAAVVDTVVVSSHQGTR